MGVDDLSNPQLLGAFAIGLLALALALFGAGWLLLAWRQARIRQAVDEALAHQQHGGAGSGVGSSGEESKSPGRMLEVLVRLGAGWAASRVGMLLLPLGDRELVDRGGYTSPARVRALFPVVRVGLAMVMLLAALFAGHVRGEGYLFTHPVVFAVLGFGLGWMLPKWVVRRRVERRLKSAHQELPLLIDLLRLLQGVGLSVDQSLHIIVEEFREVMPVLSQEFGWSLESYMRGRTREQSLARLSTQFDNEDLAAICRLLCQVDEHGGAVQEPLARFGGRLRDQYRLDLKARIGKLTVKMTGVMVLTLLPALLIVVGGPGFVAIMRGLSRISS